jgi:hypothetical protein
MRYSSFLTALLIFHPVGFPTVAMRPETTAAFDHYIQLTEKQMEQNVRNGRFLVLGRSVEDKAPVEVHTLENGKPIRVPEGQIHHWMGGVFLKGATIQKVRSTMRDYDNYKNIYHPDVIESKAIHHEGDDYDIFLRLYKKQFFTTMFNSEYHVRYESPDPRHLLIYSRSTRIAEVKDPDNPDKGEYSLTANGGLLWRLNSYWRFEEGDGGIYAECEAISLSRDVPPLLGALAGPFIKRFPAESLRNTLAYTARAVRAMP